MSPVGNPQQFHPDIAIKFVLTFQCWTPNNIGIERGGYNIPSHAQPLHYIVCVTLLRLWTEWMEYSLVNNPIARRSHVCWPKFIIPISAFKLNIITRLTRDRDSSPSSSSSFSWYCWCGGWLLKSPSPQIIQPQASTLGVTHDLISETHSLRAYQPLSVINIDVYWVCIQWEVHLPHHSAFTFIIIISRGIRSSFLEIRMYLTDVHLIPLTHLD